MSVVRRHAVLRSTSHECDLINVGSRNRYLPQLDESSHTTLARGDQIQIGLSKLAFLSAPAADHPDTRPHVGTRP